MLLTMYSALYFISVIIFRNSYNENLAIYIRFENVFIAPNIRLLLRYLLFAGRYLKKLYEINVKVKGLYQLLT